MRENTLAAATVTASDANGDTLAFSISGGADAADFTIAPATGVVTARTLVDFEAPADADGNNSYEIIVSVTDSRGGTTSAPLSINVINVAGDGYLKIKGAATGDAIGAKLAGSPDIDGDADIDLVVGLFKSTPTLPISESFGYLLFSSAFRSDVNTTVSLANLVAAQGINFFHASLGQNNVIWGSLVVGAGRAFANALGDAYILIQHPTIIGFNPTITAFFPNAVPDVKAVGSINLVQQLPPLSVRTSRNNLGTGPGTFASRSMLRPADAFGDFDGDGLTDMATRNFLIDGQMPGDILVVSGTQLLKNTSPNDLFNASAPGSGAVILDIDGGFALRPNGVFIQNAGDVTGDRVDDLVFSISLIIPGTNDVDPSKETIVIVSGAALFADADGIVKLSELSPSQALRIDSGAEHYNFELSPGGDMDGDGQSDVLLTSFSGLGLTTDPVTGTLGAVFIFYGAALTADPDGIVSVSELPGPKGAVVLNAGAHRFSSLRRAHSIGDIDGGGAGDLLVGSPTGLDVNSKAFLVRGEALRLQGSQALRLGALSAGQGLQIVGPRVVETTALTSDFFAEAATRAFDVDGDGVSDLIISAPGEGSTIAGGILAGAAGAIYVLPSTRVIAEMNFDGVINLAEEF